MTVLCLRDGVAVIGHVGDSRCVVLREGRLERLTEDHAVVEPRHLLTRCLGAGRDEEDVDVTETRFVPGDVFALMTDGVWGVLEDDVIARILRVGDASSAARQLVASAYEAGSTDNATAIVVRVVAEAGPGVRRPVSLSADESGLSLDAATTPQPGELWPWVLLAFGIALAALATLRFLGVV